MRFLDIINDVEEISLVKDQRDMVKRAINHALKRVYSYHDWPYYMADIGIIRTVAPYSTGLATITHGSYTATFAASALTSDYNYAKIRFGSDKEWYRIGAVTGAASLTLISPYLGDDKAAVAYEIYKDEYMLAPDVDKYKMMRNMENNMSLFSMHPSRFDQIHPNPTAQGKPMLEILGGSLLIHYAEGTVSGTINDDEITGVGTEWTEVEGLGRMSQIMVGSNVYTIASIDSDTEITIFGTLKENIAAGTTYSITLNNLVVQFHNIPDDEYSVYYRYFRIPFPLNNDYDIPDIPFGWDWLLMYGALSVMFLEKGDLNKSQIECENRFLQGLEQMKLKIGSFAPDRIYHRKSVDRMGGRMMDGLESSDFDRKYSMP